MAEKKLLGQVADALRVKHYSYRTVQQEWISFITTERTENAELLSLKEKILRVLRDLCGDTF